jgi:mRNA interferase MazF
VYLNSSRGSDLGKIRPAVVIQTDLPNSIDHPSTLICPISAQLSEEENSLRLRLVGNGTGLVQESEVVVDQIRALENRRFLEKLGKLSTEKALKLRGKLAVVMDF